MRLSVPGTTAAAKSMAEPGAAPAAGEARKKARGVQPGSFLNLMINSKHESSGRAVTNDEATAQAFTFLLAGYETTVRILPSSELHPSAQLMQCSQIHMHGTCAHLKNCLTGILGDTY